MTGDIFNIFIRVNKHTVENDVGGADCRLSFDPTFLQVVDKNDQDIVGIGAPLPLSGNESFPIPLENFVDNHSGIIRYSAGTTIGQTTPVNLINIRFRTLRKGTTAITFQRPFCSVLVGLAKGETIREVIPDSTHGFTDATIGIEVTPVSYTEGGPFNPKTGEKFKVLYSQQSGITSVILKIYTITGNLVRTISSYDVTLGFIEWDGKDESGKFVQNGVYVYQMILNTTKGKIYNKPRMVGVLK